jgi:uncharacterized protein (DUF2236 family)
VTITATESVPIKADPREGYFPAGGSVLHRVHSERAVGLLYGQRALMIGALNPVAFIGTTQRSKAHNEPWKRLTQTARLFEAVFFGTRIQADKALAFTARLHEQVRGELPDDAGPYPAGTSYSALDPELMLWVVAPMFDSAKVLYELLVRELSSEEHEQLWDEYVTFGELFGMPRDCAPASTVELDDWWQEQWDSERIFLTAHALAVGRSIATKLPLPLWARLPMRGGTHVLIGSLPERVREQYGFAWSTRDAAAFRALCATHRALRPFAPRSLASGPCLPFYKTVARQERRRVRNGHASFELPGRGAVPG